LQRQLSQQLGNLTIICLLLLWVKIAVGALTNVNCSGSDSPDTCKPDSERYAETAGFQCAFPPARCGNQQRTIPSMCAVLKTSSSVLIGALTHKNSFVRNAPDTASLSNAVRAHDMRQHKSLTPEPHLPQHACCLQQLILVALVAQEVAPVQPRLTVKLAQQPTTKSQASLPR
jgi:hypothetical protein